MTTVFVVLLALLMIASMIGASVGIDNTRQTPDEPITIATGGGLFSLVLLLLSSVILSIMVRAWGIVIMWGWFVTPIFNIPAPTKALAYGFGLFLAFFIKMPKSTPKHTKTEFFFPYYSGIAMSLTLVWVGWFVKRFFV